MMVDIRQQTADSRREVPRISSPELIIRAIKMLRVQLLIVGERVGNEPGPNRPLSMQNSDLSCTDHYIEILKVPRTGPEQKLWGVL